MITPLLRKAKRIIGKNLVLRNVTLNDAAFILEQRNDSRKSMYLSYTEPEIAKQIAYLENYSVKVDQAYFVIESLAGDPIGLVRLYDPKEDSFCWGSWVLKNGAPQYAAIESALMVYAYAIDCLGFKNAHFDVRKENESVWRFHERFGAKRVAETELDCLYEIGLNEIMVARSRYKKFLPDAIIVEH
jgi:RimJ/RimL family protein N-acetyltransferase